MGWSHSSWQRWPPCWRVTGNIPTSLTTSLAYAFLSSAQAIVVGADKYLLFPALAVKWVGVGVGGEGDPLWDAAIVTEGSGTQTSGILSSPLAPWNHNTLLALHRDGPGGRSIGVRWRWRSGAQTGNTEGGWRIESASEKTSGDGCSLRAVYMTDHQRNSRTIEQRGPVLMLRTHVAPGLDYSGFKDFKLT